MGSLVFGKHICRGVKYCTHFIGMGLELVIYKKKLQMYGHECYPNYRLSLGKICQDMCCRHRLWSM